MKMKMNDAEAWLIEDRVLSVVLDALARDLPEGAVQPEAAAPALRGEGSTAHIDIAGPLIPGRSAILDYYGVKYTAYSDLRAQIQTAEKSPGVSEVVFHVDSPGGTVAGFHETARAIASMSTPRRAVASYAASAAFGLASAIGNVEASGPEASFGSVGVAVSVPNPSKYATTLTSRNAPDKMPDPTTEEGRAVVRDRLDEMHAQFVGVIAEGRGTTPEQVNADYGRGRVFLAAEAKRRGMIDSIAATRGGESNQEAALDVVTNEETEAMDLETLKTQHPEAFRAAVALGESQERKRVSDHIKLGKEAGALDVAHEAIAAGESLSDRQADYLAANMRKQGVASMKADDAAVAKVDKAEGADNTDAGAKAAREYDEFAAGWGASDGREVTA
jgi:ClpP class serine protease